MYFSAVAWLVASCGKPDRKMGGLIDSPGSYKSPSQRYSLVVSITLNKTVRYQILATDGGAALGESDSGSDLMRWYFVWDEHDQLWVHNSDAGDWVWTPGPSFRQVNLFGEKDKAKEAPQAFYDALPESVKERYKR
jgi:hypothetical protein